MLLLVIWNCQETLNNAAENMDLASEVKSGLIEYPESHSTEKKPTAPEELHVTAWVSPSMGKASDF